MIDPDGERTITVYTDGSCFPNPNGIGGWALYCSYKGKQAVRYGSRLDGEEGKLGGQTNNRAELSAILMVLKFLPCEKKHTQPVIIYTDSDYSRRAVTEWGYGWRRNGWKTSNGKPAANKDLVAEILDLMKKHKKHREVEIKWVKGHAGIPENELCDQKANLARTTGQTNWNNDRDLRTK